ncbi:MAG: putative metalloprotease CJM1_0395 family protein [Pseudomonadota bacterium]
MLETIRSASSSALYRPLDAVTETTVERTHVPGTERPVSTTASDVVYAPEKAAEAGTGSESSVAQAADGAAKGEAQARAQDGAEVDAGREEGGESEGEQSVQEALRDPNSELSQQVRELSARDKEVRAHEQAHLAAAGPYSTYGPNYDYQTGPDGRRYAIGGEVGIDTSVVPDDPQATLAKMQVVQRAAMAPAEPSAQDMRVAADASQMAAQARMDIMREHFEARAEPAENSRDAGAETEAVENTDTEAGRELGLQAKQAVDAYQVDDTTQGELIDLAA